MGYDVIIIGAGVIGLSSALRCSQLGLKTLVIERDRSPLGSSYVAGGMLAPVTEAWFGKGDLLRLNLEAAARFPAFVAEIEEISGQTAGLSDSGTMYVALNRDQSEALGRLVELHSQLELGTELLDGDAVRELEPALHPSVRRGILAPRDLSVDPRRLLDCLTSAAKASGVELRTGASVERLEVEAPVAVVEGERIRAGNIVLAAGAWTSTIEGCPSSVQRQLRPVKGQILRLACDSSAGETMPVSRTIRTEEVYLVPRGSGELTIGATSEERGFDISPTAGGVHDLLRSAVEVVPAVREMVWLEASSGLRPATRDGLPLIGPTEHPGVIAACGHYRNGILLSALTAEAVAYCVSKGTAPDEMLAADPQRQL